MACPFFSKSLAPDSRRLSFAFGVILLLLLMLATNTRAETVSSATKVFKGARVGPTDRRCALGYTCEFTDDKYIAVNEEQSMVPMSWLDGEANDRATPRAAAAHSGKPLISFCQTVMNRLDDLKRTAHRTLDALKTQPIGSVELVILLFRRDVPGMGTQGDKEEAETHRWLLATFANEMESGLLRYFRTMERHRFWNPSVAKNTAHRVANANFLYNLDADNVLLQDELEYLLSARGGALDFGYVGRNNDVDEDELFITSESGMPDGARGRIALPRHVFEFIGGYDEDMPTEEDEWLLYRMQRLGRQPMAHVVMMSRHFARYGVASKFVEEHVAGEILPFVYAYKSDTLKPRISLPHNGSVTMRYTKAYVDNGVYGYNCAQSLHTIWIIERCLRGWTRSNYEGIDVGVSAEGVMREAADHGQVVHKYVERSFVRSIDKLDFEASKAWTYYRKTGRAMLEKEIKRGKTEGPKISLCQTVMNRYTQLTLSIKRTMEAVNSQPVGSVELVLVHLDRGDEEGARTHEWILQHLGDDMRRGTLRYFRTQEQTKFRTSMAKNTAHRLARGKFLYNLDVDNAMLQDELEFLLGHRYGSLDFVYWGLNGKYEGLDGSYGRVGLPRELFDRLGGYDQRFEETNGIAHGAEDFFLLQRAKKAQRAPPQRGEMVYVDCPQLLHQESLQDRPCLYNNKLMHMSFIWNATKTTKTVGMEQRVTTLRDVVEAFELWLEFHDKEKDVYQQELERMQLQSNKGRQLGFEASLVPAPQRQSKSQHEHTGRASSGHRMSSPVTRSHSLGVDSVDNSDEDF